jgi:6-pyruvoyltetrahydropterin/6-carboxytetrahydropterin synthase
MQVTKIFTFAAGHRLLGYQGLCSNIHGHNYKLEVTVQDEIDTMGMVVDFKELKQRVNIALAKYDHALILKKDDPLVETMKKADMRVVVMEKNPTAENMLSDLIKSLPADCELNIVKLRLWETDTSFAEVIYDLPSKRNI